MEQQRDMKQRLKQWLILSPVILIPLIVLAVWFVNRKDKPGNVQPKGLNTMMPGAVLKDDRGMDKLSFYEEMAKDSLKQKEQERNDPFFFKRFPDSVPSLSNLKQVTDPNEEKVYAKLAELNKVMQQPQQPAVVMPPQTYVQHPEEDRLAQMVQHLQTRNDDDTELQQLSRMVDKLVALQNPKRDTAAVIKTKTEAVLPAKQKNTGFFTANSFVDTNSYNAVRAMVAETQTLVNGSTIKLILEEDIVLKNRTVGKGSLVYGTVSLNNERLQITIASLRAGNNIVPVSLEAYDLDGMAGIYIPGSISRDVAKQSSNEAINGIGLTTLDPSIGAQAASAGIQAAKSLIGKKVRLVKITVKAGYQILLQQSN